MSCIVFFSNGHNGDIIHSKSFVEDISSNVDLKCLYSYNASPDIIKDIDVNYTQICPKNYYDTFIESNSILYVNTWLYPYIIQPQYNGVTLKTNYQIFDSIYKKINSVFGTNLQLKPIKEYFPFINFSKIDCHSVDQFIQNNNDKKVLFCNGAIRSGQSKYNGNMSELIIKLASTHRGITFIATEKFDHQLSNIKFTQNIINIKGCDLNEIGYLSTFCDLIIGRNSGPFCFTTIKDNLNNPNKTFYAFGHNKTDCFLHGIDIDAKFIFQSSEIIEQINSDIETLVLNL
jgi:hypothetical protein